MKIIPFIAICDRYYMRHQWRFYDCSRVIASICQYIPSPGGIPTKYTPHSPEPFVNEKNDTDFQEFISALLIHEGTKMYVLHRILIEQQANYTTQPAF